MDHSTCPGGGRRRRAGEIQVVVPLGTCTTSQARFGLTQTQTKTVISSPELNGPARCFLDVILQHCYLCVLPTRSYQEFAGYQQPEFSAISIHSLILCSRIVEPINASMVEEVAGAGLEAASAVDGVLLEAD